jgi:hypothetical protein
MEFPKFVVDEKELTEFKKYFVDEFNYLFKCYEEYNDVNDAEFMLFCDMPIILHLCFLNNKCPDKFIREVASNPKYSQGFFNVPQYKNIDKLIEDVHKFRNHLYEVDGLSHELQILSQQHVSAMAKKFINLHMNNYDENDCDENDCDENDTIVDRTPFFMSYKIFKD